MNEFICVLRPSRLEMLTEGMTTAEGQTVAQHLEYWQSKKPTLAGRTQNNDESTFGIVIFESRDMDSARQLVDADPAVKESLMQAEIFPFFSAVKGAQ